MTPEEIEQAIADVVYLSVPPSVAEEVVNAGIDLGLGPKAFKDDEVVGEIMRLCL